MQFLLFFFFIINLILDIDINTSIYSPIVLIFSLFIVTSLSVGIGLIFSSLTIKYKDLNYINSFVIGLLMYVTPVIYPISSSEGKLEILLLLNQ